MTLAGNVKTGDWIALRQLVARLGSLEFGPNSTPEFSSVKLTGLTASRLVATDSTKTLGSVTDLTSWVAGTTNQITVADDSDGTITLSTPQDIDTAATPTFGQLTLYAAPPLAGALEIKGAKNAALWDARINVREFSDDVAYVPNINMIKSRGTTVDTYVTTIDQDYLGELSWFGVSSGNAQVWGGKITCVQQGAAGASFVPTSINLQSYNTSGVNGTLTLHGPNSLLSWDKDIQITGTSQLTGHVGIGAAADVGYSLYIFSAASGATANAIADEFVLNGTSEVGFTILSSTTGNGTLAFGDSGNAVAGYIQYGHTSDFMNFGIAGGTRVVIKNSAIAIAESAAAPADVAGQGQIWVKNAAPNQLWFTDDTGVDVQLGTAASLLSTHESTYNHANYDTAYSWGNHAGLYDTVGTASGLIATHEATYVHTDIALNTTHRGLTTGNPHSVTKSEVGLGNVENTALSTWAGSTNITTLGTIGTGTWNGTTIAIANGGTGQTTAQAAIDALSQVSGATNEYVLTKDTASGNALWKAATGGSDAFTVKVDAGATADYLGTTGSNGVLRVGSGISMADGGDYVTLTTTEVDPASGARIYLSGSQSINSGVYTLVQLDTEDYDIGGEFNTGTYQFTVTNAGYYMIVAKAYLENLGAGKKLLLRLTKNGSTHLDYMQYFNPTAGAISTYGQSAMLLYLSASDYIEFYAGHDHGSALNLISGTSGTWLSIIRITK